MESYENWLSLRGLLELQHCVLGLLRNGPFMEESVA
jgi:hypothetical protein